MLLPIIPCPCKYRATIDSFTRRERVEFLGLSDNSTSGAVTLLGELRDGINGVDGLNWATSIALSPDDKFIYATGANDDAISWFERNATTGAISYAGSLLGVLEEAIRVIVSSDGKNAYAVSPIAGRALSFSRNSITGELTKIGQIQLRASGRAATNGWSRFLGFSPSQRHLYFSGAYENSILWMERHPVSGALRYGKFGTDKYQIKEEDYGSTISVSAHYFDESGNEETTAEISAGQVTLQKHTAELNSTVSLEMIWVEPGTFTMGSPTTETGRQSDETQHEVTLTKGFYLGKYEVTQAQYEAVMTGNSDGLSATPSNWQNNPNRPVEKVSWNDIQVFLSRLNEREAGNIPAGWAYVLPTEAQWEYACRAARPRLTRGGFNHYGQCKLLKQWIFSNS